MRKFILYWLPPLLYCVLIFNLSGQSSVGVSHDKMAHIAAYAVMGFLFARALRVQWNPSWAQLIFYSVLISTLYGMSDEAHQYFVPGRHCSGWDLLADFVGASLGGFAYVLSRRLPRLKSSN